MARFKGFENDGWGNSVSDEKAAELEEKYLNKWAICYTSHRPRVIFGRITDLYWAEGFHSGPLTLQLELTDERGIKFTVHSALKLFGEKKPDLEEIQSWKEANQSKYYFAEFLF